MKHLFYIHSYITFFVSLEVVKYKSLREEDCVFMYGRGFKPAHTGTDRLREVSIPFTHYPQSSFAIKRRFWESWPKLSGFNAYVYSLTEGATFHLYTNQTGIDYVRLFMSHRRCEGFSFIEEGLYSYYTFNFINNTLCPPEGKPNLTFKLLILLNYVGQLGQQKYFLAPGYSAVYGINKEAFPDFRNRHIMPYPFKKVADNPEEPEQAVLVLDSYVDYGMLDWDSFKQIMEKAFEYFHSNRVTKLAIRYHPKQFEDLAQLDRTRRLVEEIGKGLSITEVEQEQSLEMLAADPTIKNLTFYVFLSSVALYAAFCGRKAYSFAHLLVKYDASFKSRVNSLPSVFKDNVHFVG